MIELIIIVFLCAVILTLTIMTYRREKHWKLQVELGRKDAVQRSRSTLEGQIYEQLVPFLPGFEYDPSDCRFLGSPIDLIVFKGLSKNNVTGIDIVEIKKGKSKTTPRQNSIKRALKEGKVRWRLLKIDDNGRSTLN